MKIVVKDVKLIGKNNIVSSFSVVLEDLGMIIRDLTMFEKDGKRWANLPCRVYDSEGVKKYYSFVVFEPKEKYIDFQNEVRKAYDLVMGQPPKVVSIDDGLPF